MKIVTIKKVIKAVTSIGIGIIVKNIIKSSNTSSVGIVGRICVAIAGFMVAGIICDKTDVYVDKLVDDTVRDTKEVLAELK